MKKFLFIILLPLLSFGQIFTSNYEFNCDDSIELITDKFNSKKSYYTTPILDKISFMKTKDGTIYLSLTSISSYLTYDSLGVVILLKDGTKIIRSKANIDVGVDSNGDYKYTSFFALTANEISRIIKNPITDYKLYIFDMEADKNVNYSKMLECLKNKKF